MKKFGQVLNQIRKKNFLTQKTVCDLAGISISYLSLLERSKRTAPSLEIIFKLSSATQATAEQRVELLNAAYYEMGLNPDESELPHEAQELIVEIRKNASHVPKKFFKALTEKIREIRN